ncbi:MAG TPA: efflux transporter outer membrane subunit [Burkholderiaceae bacterium]|nr:efflux transporter outer membrane subunit [Burkholderiaceae bacterium]
MNKPRLLVAAMALALSACASPPTGQERLPLDLPEQWGTAASQAPVASDWWRVFGDAQLDALVNEALNGNTDLARAVARVDESRAALRIANADRFPAVYGTANASRARLSSIGRQPLPASTPAVNDAYSASLNVQYEVDLWGRIANTARAARADLLATEAARDTVRLAVASQAARSYFSLRALDAAVDSTKRLLEAQRASLQLQRVRAQAGAISQFDLDRFEAEVAANESRLPTLENQRSQAQTALAVLLGRSPRDVYTPRIERLESTMARGPVAVVAAPAGLPSELLLRRPDIRVAEQNLAAADARVSAARANYFPAIVLTGSLGSESADLSSLFTGPAAVWSFAAALTQPIFQAGRLFAQTDAALARQRQLEADYRNAVATAFKEVRDALTGVEQARLAFDAQTRRLEALERARKLAQLRYENGYASQLDVIDADRQALEAAIGQAEAERDQRNAVVDMFRALGGGWAPAS